MSEPGSAASGKEIIQVQAYRDLKEFQFRFSFDLGPGLALKEIVQTCGLPFYMEYFLIIIDALKIQDFFYFNNLGCSNLDPKSFTRQRIRLILCTFTLDKVFVISVYSSNNSSLVLFLCSPSPC